MNNEQMKWKNFNSWSHDRCRTVYLKKKVILLILKLRKQRFRRTLKLLNNLFVIQTKQNIFAGDFNIFFNLKSETQGGKPLTK